MSDVENVIIVGSGPAGYTAALYTARANLTEQVVRGAHTGSQYITMNRRQGRRVHAMRLRQPASLAGAMTLEKTLTRVLGEVKR